MEQAGRHRAILLRDKLFQIWQDGRIVWCEVVIAANVTPEEGAAAGKAMGHYLVNQVLVTRSTWHGVILDVRRGPSVVGPVTLQVNERILKAAEDTQKPIAVLLGAKPTLRSQYASLCSQYAPRFSMLTTEPKVALDWLMKPRATA